MKKLKATVLSASLVMNMGANLAIAAPNPDSKDTNPDVKTRQTTASDVKTQLEAAKKTLDAAQTAVDDAKAQLKATQDKVQAAQDQTDSNVVYVENTAEEHAKIELHDLEKQTAAATAAKAQAEEAQKQAKDAQSLVVVAQDTSAQKEAVVSAKENLEA